MAFLLVRILSFVLRVGKFQGRSVVPLPVFICFVLMKLVAAELPFLIDKLALKRLVLDICADKVEKDVLRDLLASTEFGSALIDEKCLFSFFYHVS